MQTAFEVLVLGSHWRHRLERLRGWSLIRGVALLGIGADVCGERLRLSAPATTSVACHHASPASWANSPLFKLPFAVCFYPSNRKVTHTPLMHINNLNKLLGLMNIVISFDLSGRDE